MKNASDAADQTDPASVMKPIGLNMRVAGSSLIARTKMRDDPAIIPGLMRGSVIFKSIRKGFAPNPRAASSTWGLICWRDARNVPIAGAINKIL